MAAADAAGLTNETAYAVAERLRSLRIARGERPVGWKIGFTNRNIWPEYGATAPIWAHVYDRTVVVAERHRAAISLKGSGAPRKASASPSRRYTPRSVTT